MNYNESFLHNIINLYIHLNTIMQYVYHRLLGGLNTIQVNNLKHSYKKTKG